VALIIQPHLALQAKGLGHGQALGLGLGRDDGHVGAQRQALRARHPRAPLLILLLLQPLLELRLVRRAPALRPQREGLRLRQILVLRGRLAGPAA
jgi:hypothetical protein